VRRRRPRLVGGGLHPVRGEAGPGRHRWLGQAPPLAGKPVGVFVTYAVHPRGSLGVLRRGVEARGGKVVAEHASRRRDPEAGAADFARRLLAAG
jgi:hypothetical protein